MMVVGEAIMNRGGDNSYSEERLHCIFTPRRIRSKVAKLFLVSCACFFASLRENFPNTCGKAINNGNL